MRFQVKDGLIWNERSTTSAGENSSILSNRVPIDKNLILSSAIQDTIQSFQDPYPHPAPNHPTSVSFFNFEHFRTRGMACYTPQCQHARIGTQPCQNPT